MGMRHAVSVAILCLVLLLCSCVSTAGSSRFSLGSKSLETSSQSRLITGSVSYGAGFYFPASTDILDISLLRTDGTTGVVSEISHQRIRNIQRFPLQFTVRYDEVDVHEGDSFMLMVSLSVDGRTVAQGFGNLYEDMGAASGFKDISIVLSALEQ